MREGVGAAHCMACADCVACCSLPLFPGCCCIIRVCVGRQAVLATSTWQGSGPEKAPHSICFFNMLGVYVHC